MVILGPEPMVSIPRREHARLLAVEAAVRALLAEKGQITRAKVTAATEATGH